MTMKYQHVEPEYGMAVCPACRLIQNPATASAATEAGWSLTCPRCGETFTKSAARRFEVLLSDYPHTPDALATLQKQLEHDFGSEFAGLAIDGDGGAVARMEPSGLTLEGDNDLLTTREAAEYLGIGYEALKSRVRYGKYMPAIHTGDGGVRLFRRGDLRID